MVRLAHALLTNNHMGYVMTNKPTLLAWTLALAII